VADSTEAQPDAVMLEADLLQSIAQAVTAQKFDGRVLEHSGANSIFDMVAAAGLEHDGIDAVGAKQMRQHESGWSGSDDGDLGARHFRVVILTAPSCAIARWLEERSQMVAARKNAHSFAVALHESSFEASESSSAAIANPAFAAGTPA
jgi:hypothetical protein